MDIVCAPMAIVCVAFTDHVPLTLPDTVKLAPAPNVSVIAAVDPNETDATVVALLSVG